MTPEDTIKAARLNGGWEKFNPGPRIRTWPKLNVYNQSEQTDPTAAQHNIDPDWCVGCAVANAYQAVTRKVGQFARLLYERTKRLSDDPEDALWGGSKITPVARTAVGMWGGDYYHLKTLSEALSWIMVTGPIVIGMKWTQDMEFTTGRGPRWSWRRWFGPRWMANRGDTFGYHCVAAIATSSADGGFIIIENSRGLNWGNKGTARLSWKDLNSMMNNKEAYVVGFNFPQSD